MEKAAWFGLLALGVMFAWLIAAVALVQPARADDLAVPAAVAGKATLTIFVENVQEGGTLRLGLYDRTGYSDNVNPVATADVKAVAGETAVVLHEVPSGVYAVETYQDVNDNDRMDLTWLGLPLEPYGFSRDAHPVLSKPPFSKVKFTLATGEQSITLHLQNGVSFVASK